MSVTARRLAALIAALSLLPLVAVAPVSAAATIVVNSLADGAPADDLACTLREALTVASLNTADLGCAAGSTGVDTITFSVAGTITATSALPDVDGAVVVDGAGTITIVGGNFDPALVSVTSGSLTLRRIEITNAISGVSEVASGATLVLDRVNIPGGGSDVYVLSEGTVTVTDSNLSGARAGGTGGAIFNIGGTATITRTTFTDNQAVAGPAVYMGSGTTTIVDSTFTGNASSGTAGAVLNNGGVLTVTGSTFTNNSAQQGAAIRAESDTHISSSTFTNNTVSGEGGAIVVASGTTTVTGSTFTANGAQNGGAISNFDTLEVTDSTFSSNEVVGSGGAISTGATASIAGSTFTGNLSANGGAVLAAGAAIDIANSTFFGNSATSNGGALHINTAAANLESLTVVGNDAATAGGGIFNQAATNYAKNTIVLNNTAPTGDNVGGNPFDLSLANVTAFLGTLSTYLDTAGPKANGGPTDTIRLYAVNGSPFINQADSTTCTNGLALGKDQRGVTRPSACDIGAFEAEAVAPVVTSTPKASLRTGVALSGSSLRTTVKWAATDINGSGVQRYVLQRSVNGGSWATLSSNVLTTAYNTSLTPGKAYRFRVRAVDFDGNQSAYSAGPTVTPRLVQQSSTAVKYKGTWTTTTSTKFSGGSARRASASGASVSLTFTGRGVSFVTTLGDRGVAKIYIDGSLAKTVDLGSATTTYRVQSFVKTWSSSGTHTIRVVVTNPAGTNRIDADAFAILR